MRSCSSDTWRAWKTRPSTSTDIRVFLQDQAHERQPTFRVISGKAAKYFSVTIQQLRGPSRRSQVVRARGVAMLLARNLTGKSLEMIGQYFGHRDHTTVLHACRKTESLRHTDPAISQSHGRTVGTAHCTPVAPVKRCGIWRWPLDGTTLQVMRSEHRNSLEPCGSCGKLVDLLSATVPGPAHFPTRWF